MRKGGLAFAFVAGICSFQAYSFEWHEILNVKPGASPHQILGLPSDATSKDLDQAFHNLSSKYQPEKWVPENRLGPLRPTSISKEETQAVMKVLLSAKEKLESALKTQPATSGSKVKSDYKFKFKETDWEFEMSVMSFEGEFRPGSSRAKSDLEREQLLYAHAAVRFSDIEAMKYAIAIGFDPQTRNSFLFPSVLIQAIEFSRVELAEFILTQNIDTGDTEAMSLAAMKGLLSVVKGLHKRGMRIDNIRDIEDANHHHIEKTTNVGDIAKVHGHTAVLDWYLQQKKKHTDL